jgi:translation initiation factor 1 (eIF-1/SUI1)
MAIFSVSVRYRTNTGCNTKLFPQIEASDLSEAITIATDKIRGRRGVVKIDGGDAVQVTA